MSEFKKHPIDLTLWRRSSNAPKSEWWKWDWRTWDPIIRKIFNGEEMVVDLECPVCGEKKLYAYYLAGSIVIHKSKGSKRIYKGSRFFGCHACDTQVRDRGEIPKWMEDRDIVWASKIVKERAEEEFEQVNRLED